MKNALRFIITYLILLIAGSIVGTVLYSLYLNVTNFTAGTPFELFNMKDVLRSYVYISGCLIFLICPFMAYYRIRHVFGILQTVSYAVISILSWFVLFPVTVNVNKFIVNRYNLTESEKTLSGGYFRTVDDTIYYLVADYDRTGNTPVIVIDTSSEKNVTFREIKPYENFELLTAGKNYSDVIIKGTFSSSSIPFLVNFKTLINNGIRTLEKNYLWYITFLSIAFALCSLYAFTAFFKWRLLNVGVHVLLTAGILSLNSMFYTSAFESLRMQISELSFFSFLGRFVYEPFLFVANILTGLIFILLGTVKYFLTLHSEE